MDNKGWMPGRAGDNASCNIPASDFVQGTSQTWDWIAWHRKTDPITGQTGLTSSDENITNSALAKYLGVKEVVTKSADQANNVARNLESVFRCPADNLDARPNAPGGKAVYRYSYSVNDWISNPNKTGTNGRTWGEWTGKLSSVKPAAQIIMYVCEDPNTIDDGSYRGTVDNWVNGKSCNVLSGAHDKRHTATKGNTYTENNIENCSGNVVYCDGHTEFISRKDAVRAKFTGNPVPDKTISASF